jgi:hypothetical protein
MRQGVKVTEVMGVMGVTEVTEVTGLTGLTEVMRRRRSVVLAKARIHFELGLKRARAGRYLNAGTHFEFEPVLSCCATARGLDWTVPQGGGASWRLIV